MLPSERAWVAALDIAAWGVLETLDAEAAENAERKARGLPPLPKVKRLKGAQPGTIQIIVGGERRTVPAPPPGAFYDSAGRLIQPGQGVRRF